MHAQPAWCTRRSTGSNRSGRTHAPAVGWVLCLAAFVAAPAWAGQTLEIASYADLQRAAKISEQEDVNLLVRGEVRVPRGVAFRGKDSIVRIVGASPDAGFFLDMVWDGDWGRKPKPSMNGLQFYSRQVILHGLTFRGFEHNGAVIKGHGRELLSISSCTFKDIGTVSYPSRTRRPKTLDDAVATGCVGAHGMKNGHIEIINSTFINCAYNAHRWGRCIYCSARSITLIGNRFERCGNPFTFNKYVDGSSTIIDNQIIDPMPSYDQPNDSIRPPFITVLRPERSLAMLFTTVRGEVVSPFIGEPDPRTHWLDYNDYRGVQLVDPTWAIVAKIGGQKMEKWKASGLDRHSIMPEKPFKPFDKQAYVPEKPIKVTPGPDLEPRDR